MNWKKLELSSRDTINNFLKGQFETSDLNFTNLYLWSFSEDIMFKIEENTLYLKGVFNQKEYYFMPISSEIDKIILGINKLEVLNRKILFIPEKIAKTLHKKVKENRDSFDYIYTQVDLSTLSGRRFSAKKNKINKFLKNYNYSYESISDNIEEIKIFQKEWAKQKGESNIIKAETLGIDNILSNYEALELRGGVIKVDNKVIAYSIGEKLTNNMGVIHIEKADISYQGAYQMINMLVAKNEFSDVEFINREDDFGDEGLREAKLSYHPIKLLKKYTLNY